MKDIELFRCKHCGKIIELIPSTHCCPTICCGDEMDQLKANKEDASLEKHVPFVEINGDELKVSVGSVLHPMTKEHHIMFIYLITDKTIRRIDLEETQEPIVTFNIHGEKPIKVYEMCNLHGLWVKEL